MILKMSFKKENRNSEEGWEAGEKERRKGGRMKGRD